MSWQALEDEVRAIAAAKWNLPCVPEHLNGVDIDGVIRIRDDYLVLIEITKQNTLAKVRDDIIKLNTVANSLFAKRCFAECYFICEKPTSTMRESGAGQNVTVLDPHEFASRFLGAPQYTHQRSQKPFGSAVHPDTGEKDTIPYTEIYYATKDGGRLNIKQITDGLRSKKKYILTGEFGSGKSRCLMEIFNYFAADGISSLFCPVAINLRDNWGYKRGAHIVQNHLDGLGLTDFAPVFIKSISSGAHPLLLDGFDEIGSQSWTGEANRLAEIRSKSLEGVRNLIAASSGCGLFITGRDHYFNSDEEMIECLGIGNDYIHLTCPSEFTESEATRYLSAISGFQDFPPWLPRKPLICQLLTRLDRDEIVKISNSSNGEMEFFENVFDAICAREASISPSVAKETVKRVLLDLAQDSRSKSPLSEKITPSEINEAFFRSTGYAAIDESAILLQRLPYLGRFSTDSHDRMFVDDYAKDALRGFSLAASLVTNDARVSSSRWRQPLADAGIAAFLAKVKPDEEFRKFANKSSSHGNEQVQCDYVAILNSYTEGGIDFRSILINGGEISRLAFVDGVFKNITIRNVVVGVIELRNFALENVNFQSCIFEKLLGVGTRNRLPEAFGNDCEISEFDGATNVSRISEMQLSDAHKTLLAIIRKLFFQPGAGRQEEALLRGTEGYWDREAAEKIMKYMVRNRIAFFDNGNQGKLVIPQRRFTKRMANIYELRSSSDDELWALV